jgi:hypothetical protein
LLSLTTIELALDALWGQYMWIDHRNYPGGPVMFFQESAGVWYAAIGFGASAMANILGDGLLVRSFHRGISRETLYNKLTLTAISMLHNLGLAMVYHYFPGTYIPRLRWCAIYHPCR